MRLRTAFLLPAVLCLIFASTAAHADVVRISAAASLREVVNELAERFAHEHPGTTFIKNFGGSGTLARQIENGAPADVVILANIQWMDHLTRKGLIDKTTVAIFARNSLVFVGQSGHKVGCVRDVARLRSVAVGSPKSVPAGEYAVQALDREGLMGVMKNKLVYTRDVREALMYAERGEVDGAFVYRTDAAEAMRVKVLFEVPAHLHSPILNPAALTSAGVRKGAAAAFHSYLNGYEARSILIRYGFDVK